RAINTAIDSIPVRAVGRDARGAVISDATVSVASSVGVPFHTPWAGPSASVNVGAVAVLTPAITGITLPDNNPLAPQVPVVINHSTVSIAKVDTVKAGSHPILGIFLPAFDSTGLPASGAPVVFSAPAGPIPAAVVTDINGQASTTWTPLDSAATYTLT